MPAALAEPPGAEAVAARVAALQGCERGVLGPSTLHLFWDLFGLLGREGAEIYLDEGTYPLGRWGVERAGSLGATVRTFPHGDVGTLRRLLKRRAGRKRPVVVADGMSAVHYTPLPVRAYLGSVQDAGGLLVLDDTQALGILGTAPTSQAPYGWGGGGSLRFHGLSAGESRNSVLLVSSLAKAFGAPVAVLSGSREQVARWRTRSETRVCCSPPSVAAIRAAERALALNASRGDELRQALARRVRFFHRRLAQAGFSATRTLFPVQTLLKLAAFDARRAHRFLAKRGIEAVLRKDAKSGAPRLTFVFTVRHSRTAIDVAVQALREARVDQKPGTR